MSDVEVEDEEAPEVPSDEEKLEAAKPAKRKLKDAEGGAATKAMKAVGGKPEDVVVGYLCEQNRPYSAIQIFDNLHRVVKKAHVQKILDDLSSDHGPSCTTKLACKSWKKSKVYWANQNLLPEANNTELDNMDSKIQELTAQLAEAEAKARSAESELASLGQEPTNAEADDKITSLEAEVSKKQAKLDSMGDDSKLVSKADMAAKQQKYNKYFLEWRKRRKAVMDMVNTFCENCGKKPVKVMSEIGVETDEDVRADLKKYETLMKR